MFENNADNASIPQEYFKKICDTVMNEAKEKNEDMQRDVLIGNYFKPIKHCEGIGTDKLQFVHRSIYEYFVVIYFFESVHELKSIEKLAGKLGELLKYGHLSKQILEFINCKFDSIEGFDLPKITKDIFNIMLRDGMTYYMDILCKNPIKREINIFSNMLEVMHLWNPKLGKLDDGIVSYLKYNYSNKLNLSGGDFRYYRLVRIDLSEANLIGADLRKGQLYKADLREADLRRADLKEIDLRRADLKEIDLREADLYKADLRGADLRKTDLREANLIGADLYKADLREADLDKADLSEEKLEDFINEEEMEFIFDKYV